MRSPALLLWAHAILLWVVANYSVLDASFETAEAPIPRSGVPSAWRLPLRLAFTTSAAVAVGVLSSSWTLAAVCLLCATALAVLRARGARWRMAEREIIASALFAGLAWIVINRGALELRFWVLLLGAPGERVAVALLVTALFVVTIHGGTYVVRGVLLASGVPNDVSTADSTRGVSSIELKRGRLIGALERALLFIVLVAGS